VCRGLLLWLLPAGLGLLLRGLGLLVGSLLLRGLLGGCLLGPARVRALRGVRLLLGLGLRRGGGGCGAGEVQARPVGRVAQVHR
jgi:hypothetical protein